MHDRAQKKGGTFKGEKKELPAEKQPMHEFSIPEQIGALTAFLCTDDARTIAGAPLSVDCGWLALRRNGRKGWVRRTQRSIQEHRPFP